MLSPAPTQQSFGNLVGESVEMGISATGKLFDIFFDKVYTHKLLAVYREIMSNAADAHIEAGYLELPVDERPAFKVCVPTSVDFPTFICRDFGLGMSYETVMGLYATPFNSTKSANNNVTGMLGIGSKSPFAVADSFIVVSIFEGLKSVYLVHRNDQGNPALTVLSSGIPTSEPSGVEVRVEVNSDFLGNRVDVRRDFEKALLGFAGKHAVEVYSDPELLEIDDVYSADESTFGKLASIPQVFKYNLGDGFEPHDVSLFHMGVAGLRGGVHIRQGTAVYPLEPTSLGSLESARIRLFSAIRGSVVVIIDVPLGTCDVSPDRESLSMDAITTRNLNTLVTAADSQIYSQVLATAKKLYMQDTRGFGWLVASNFACNVYANPVEALDNSGIPSQFTVNGLNKLYPDARRHGALTAAVKPMDFMDGMWFQGSRVSRQFSNTVLRNVLVRVRTNYRKSNKGFVFSVNPAASFNPETGRTHLLVLEPNVDMKYTGRRKAAAVAEIMLRNGRDALTVDDIYEKLMYAVPNISEGVTALTEDQLIVIDVNRGNPLIKALVKRFDLGHDQLHFLSDFEPSLSPQRNISGDEDLKGEIVAGAATGVYQTYHRRFVRNTYSLEELRDPEFWKSHKYVIADRRPALGSEFNHNTQVWTTDNQGKPMLRSIYGNGSKGNGFVSRMSAEIMDTLVTTLTGHASSTVESGFAMTDYLWDLSGRLGLNQVSSIEYLVDFSSSAHYRVPGSVPRSTRARNLVGKTQFHTGGGEVPSGIVVFTETSFARVNPPAWANFVTSGSIVVDSPAKYRRALRLADKAYDEMMKLKGLLIATDNLKASSWSNTSSYEEFASALLMVFGQRELTKHLNKYFDEVLGMQVSQVINPDTCTEEQLDVRDPFKTLAGFLIIPSIFDVDSSDVGGKVFTNGAHVSMSWSSSCVTPGGDYGPYALPRITPDSRGTRYRQLPFTHSIEYVLSGSSTTPLPDHSFDGTGSMREAMRVASWVNRFVSRMPEIAAQRAPGWALAANTEGLRKNYLSVASDAQRGAWLEAVGIDTTVTTMDTADVASMIRSATQRQESE